MDKRLNIAALNYAVIWVLANQAGFQLNDTHQLLFHADVVNILSGSISTIKKYMEDLVAASKRILEVNDEKTKYCTWSCLAVRMQGRSHNINTDNSSFERVEQFGCLGTTLTNQNSIQVEIKTSLKPGNACYHSVQNVLCSSVLSKNIKGKIYRTIILPVVLYGCETWSFMFREERRLRVLENILA